MTATKKQLLNDRLLVFRCFSFSIREREREKIYIHNLSEYFFFDFNVRMKNVNVLLLYSIASKDRYLKCSPPF
jgi:hypothetical protein